MSYLIQCAMREEVPDEVLVNYAAVLSLSTGVGKPVPDDRQINIVVSGVGKVAAASAVSTAIGAGRGKSGVVSVGYCGGLSKELRPGDIVVPNAVFQHDYGACTGRGDWFARPGMRTLQYEKAPFESVLYQSEDLLVDKLLRVCSAGGASVLRGVMGSGDLFMTRCTSAALAFLASRAVAIDMESAAVAQVCELHGIPFAAVRVVSDTCGDDSEFEYLKAVESFNPRYSAVLTGVVGALLEPRATIAPISKAGESPKKSDLEYQRQASCDHVAHDNEHKDIMAGVSCEKIAVIRPKQIWPRINSEMTTKLITGSHPFADTWIAFSSTSSADYYYGGTRMVIPTASDAEVQTLLLRLMDEESAFKNRLINIALKSGAIDRNLMQSLPSGFLDSVVGGARCIIRPNSQHYYDILQNPIHPAFTDTVGSLFESIGRSLNEGGGVVKLTPDFGRFAGLADVLARFTPHVLGIRCEDGGCGGKASYAVTGITNALEHFFERHDWVSKSVTIVGSAGALGEGVTRYLLSRRFADVAVCDLRYDEGEASPPHGVLELPSTLGRFTDQSLVRGGLIVATTFGSELMNSNWERIPAGAMLVLAHNLSLPAGDEGAVLVRKLRDRGVEVIPGQMLTFGGALTSRLEWYWRQNNLPTMFDKKLAHSVVNNVSRFLFTRIEEQMRISSLTYYEAMLNFAKINQPGK